MLRDLLSLDEMTIHELSKPLPSQPEMHDVEPDNLIRAKRVEKKDGDLRRLAIQKLKNFILEDPRLTRLGQVLAPGKGQLVSEEEIKLSVEHSFSHKSSSALYKRACSLSRYSEWCKQTYDDQPLNMTEEKLYAYLSTLAETSGATSGASFIEAVRFLDGVAQFSKMNVRQLLSPRVTGLAHTMYLTKKPLRQKSPIPAWAVQELELKLVRSHDQVAQCISGQLLWCFHSGGRWSDSQRLKNIEIHKADEEVVLVCSSLGSKTSIAKETKTRLIPYVCVGTGLTVYFTILYFTILYVTILYCILFCFISYYILFCFISFYLFPFCFILF